MTVSIVADIFGSTFEVIKQYVDILGKDGVERGLIGPRETGRLWDRHILNSVALSALVPADAVVVDVGSGAGLPGIPLAILRPDLRVTLLEPLLRRSTFLAETVAALELADRAQVVRGRAEDHRQHYAVVMSRALAPLGRLITWCGPLCEPNGVILALKGRSAAEEISAAGPQLRRARLKAELVSVSAHPEAESATVVRLIR